MSTLLGILLFLAGYAFLLWREGRAQQRRALQEQEAALRAQEAAAIARRRFGPRRELDYDPREELTKDEIHWRCGAWPLDELLASPPDAEYRAILEQSRESVRACQDYASYERRQARDWAARWGVGVYDVTDRWNEYEELGRRCYIALRALDSILERPGTERAPSGPEPAPPPHRD